MRENTRRLFNRAKRTGEWGSSPVTIKKLGKTNSPHGGGTVRGSNMH
jgi:hypothetical protein